MIMISCRRNFTDSRAFGDANQIRKYPNLSNLDVFETMDITQLQEEARAKHVLVLVHGFRNPLSNVAASYKRLEQGLSDAGLLGTSTGYSLVLGFTWPGFETVLGFFPAIPFANRSAGYLRSLLEPLCSTAHTVDVQTHSLGARVALQTLSSGPECFIDNLMLTAPAVDDESIEPKKEFHAAVDQCRRCLVYHSDRDNVLKVSYRIGDAPEFDKALGEDGPQHPKIVQAEMPSTVVVNCTKVVASHGGYRDAPSVYEHWSRVLNETPLAQFETLEASTAGPSFSASRPAARRRTRARKAKAAASA
jgi:esterase/lipase superfamily enzyme